MTHGAERTDAASLFRCQSPSDSNADVHTNLDEFVELCICSGLGKTRLRSEVREWSPEWRVVWKRAFRAGASFRGVVGGSERIGSSVVFSRRACSSRRPSARVLMSSSRASRARLSAKPHEFAPQRPTTTPTPLLDATQVPPPSWAGDLWDAVKDERDKGARVLARDARVARLWAAEQAWWRGLKEQAAVARWQSQPFDARAGTGADAGDTNVRAGGADILEVCSRLGFEFGSHAFLVLCATFWPARWGAICGRVAVSESRGSIDSLSPLAESGGGKKVSNGEEVGREGRVICVVDAGSCKARHVDASRKSC